MEYLAKIHKDTLAAVEAQVVTMLENFLRVSKVIIITNAKKGWVEYSSKILLPKVHQLITEHIPVKSARGEFEHRYQGQISEWKKAAFMSLWDVKGLIDKDAITNLIVIGDSQNEIDAAKHFQKSNENCIAK